jgi:hypothetical protein
MRFRERYASTELDLETWEQNGSYGEEADRACEDANEEASEGAQHAAESVAEFPATSSRRGGHLRLSHCGSVVRRGWGEGELVALGEPGGAVVEEEEVHLVILGGGAELAL